MQLGQRLLAKVVQDPSAALGGLQGQCMSRVACVGLVCLPKIMQKVLEL